MYYMVVSVTLGFMFYAFISGKGLTPPPKTKPPPKKKINIECCEQSWTSPGGNTPQDTNCSATCLLSRKLFKLDEPDMQDTAREAGMSS